MKKYFLLILSLFPLFFLQGQSFHLGGGINTVINNYPKQLYISGGMYQIGYTQKIYKRISLETGFSFLHHSFEPSGWGYCGTGAKYDVISNRVRNAQVPLTFKVDILPKKITQNWDLNIGLGVAFNKLSYLSEVEMLEDGSIQRIKTNFPHVIVRPLLPLEISRKITSKWWAGIYCQMGGSELVYYSPQSFLFRVYYKIW